jgi:hypothetical protein
MALSDPERVRALLGATGFAEVDIDGFAAGMWFGEDADDAYDFVLGQLGWMLQGLDEGQRARALQNLRSTTVAHDTGEGVIFGSAAWTITAIRR